MSDTKEDFCGACVAAGAVAVSGGLGVFSSEDIVAAVSGVAGALSLVALFYYRKTCSACAL